MHRPRQSAIRVAQSNGTTTGATTNPLATSPSHQVSQIGAKFSQSAWPAKVRLPTPTVALTMAPGASATSANLATPIVVSNVRRPSDHRPMRYPPITASSVLPIAIAADVSKTSTEVGSATLFVTLAANAPSRIAGQSRIPPTRTQPSATPVQGQTGLALGWIDANANPASARAK
jgi:hypothetical protein